MTPGDRGPRVQDLHRRLGIAFVLADLYAPETVASLWSMADMRRARGRNLLLLCDGGNKHRELALYSAGTRPGDLLLCHDKGTEFLPDRHDALEVEAREGLERVHVAELDADGTWLAAYVRRAR